MTNLLTSDDRRKLIGVLGRLASDHDGERAAAGLLATRMLQARGLVWDQIVGPGIVRAAYRDSAPPSGNDNLDWRATVADCRRHSALLSDRETEFLASLCRWTGTLTPKQAAWLERIAAKVASGRDTR